MPGGPLGMAGCLWVDTSIVNRLLRPGDSVVQTYSVLEMTNNYFTNTGTAIHGFPRF
jgi:hypothetical protein